ncbi:hypothetical protein GCM10009854_13130 [Saccharopolyspora halophila]|uniref:Uncharacterized protein n=1 Tax=Saccharopolyspora halophila TaxID=405551 RepID=A0ABN3FV01_9PSEU
MLRNIPVVMSHYKMQVTEEPVVKTRENETGEIVPVTDWQGAQQFVVSLFVKARPQEGQRPGKGEEIRVTLETAPDDDVTDGAVVELHNPRVSHWENDINGRKMSGLSWKATGIKRAA